MERFEFNDYSEYNKHIRRKTQQKLKYIFKPFAVII